VAIANCPACGGRIEFTIGSSAVVVCDYCRSVIARTDRALEDLGKVAALIDTGSPLQRGMPGKYHGIGFRIVGRTQMRHQAGGVWDEWYAAFDDGRWGWLAEAQGKYYVSFKTAEAQLPTRAEIAVGGRFEGMMVSEVGTATIISGEGEIPWKVVPASTYDYADLSGSQGRFATIDYSEETPLLFKGQETTLGDLGIAVAQEPKPQKGVRVAKLSCSKCGGPLTLVAPDQAERVVCPNCGAMHEVAEGNLSYLETLKARGPKPRIPLGSRGKIEGRDYAVAGYVVRSVTFDQKYFWSEYLLFNAESGFRWLVDSDDHWSFVQPISAGDVTQTDASAKAIQFREKTFRLFQDAPATVEYVLGEFYWKVRVGETGRALDYIAPPEGISIEYSGGKGSASEANFSLGRYMPVAEVEQAFGVRGLPKPSGVGMLQPNPGMGIADLWAKFAAALLVLGIILGITRARHEVFNDMVHFGAAAVTPAPTPVQAQWGSGDPRHVVFTNAFKLAGGKNLEIEGYSEVQNAWLYVAGDLINEQGAIVDSFELPIEYYEGYDDGHWSEGSRNRNAYIAAVPAGNYSIRLEGDWDPAKESNPRVLLKVREGVFRWSHLFMAFIGLTIPAMIFGFRPMTFESRRWAESNFTQSGSQRSAPSSSDDNNET
jgi:hypothetical protein